MAEVEKRTLEAEAMLQSLQSRVSALEKARTVDHHGASLWWTFCALCLETSARPVFERFSYLQPNAQEGPTSCAVARSRC
eukprot:scaffold236_cov228-Pinguiococcus_pyrenoidosus.AAC.7